MFIHYILIISPFFLPLKMAWPPAVEGTFEGAKPGCLSQCGNKTVPYPFGIGEGCSLSEFYNLTCNSSSETENRKLLWQHVWPVLSITDSEMRSNTFVNYKCYDKSGAETSDQLTWQAGGYGTFSLSVKNKLTVIGCDDYGLMRGANGNDLSSGCIGLCTEFPQVSDHGRCSGNGCRQTSIRKGIQNYDVQLKSFRNHTDVWSFNRCGFAFLAEEDSFQFNSTRDLSVQTSLKEFLWLMNNVPIVYDWVIGVNSCAVGNVCKDNSFCIDIEGGGYRCSCIKGYHGNPYLDKGCQDINECQDPTLHGCFGDCINTLGSYKCMCPQGTNGNPKTPNGCIAKDSKFPRTIFIIGVVLGTGLLLSLIWIHKLVTKRKERKQREKFFKRNGGLLLQQQISSGDEAHVERTKLFSATDLEKATDQYNENRIVGRGGQGAVYKGMLTDGRIVAVKKSKLVDECQVETFINEVFLLSQISHKNVVKLIGCCLETEVPVLVYEFISNGTLFQFIHDENYEFPTFWSMRLQIATEIAAALAYLHSGISLPIYHRDIKSSNILLDEKFRAKLSDFGISKSVLGDQTHLSTLVKGTFGYIDPEYFHSHQFTEKSDVYSLGIVLVELLTGKKPIFSIGPGESRSLATLVLSTNEGLVLENLDNRVLEGSKEQLIAVAILAKRCLNLDGKLRPTMREVATELEALRSAH